MQNTQQKILAFEYVLSQLLDWQKEQKDIVDNDLSILKALKLLFFVSASCAKESEPSLLIDSVFDNFVAMPYGHVESGIYNFIRDNNGELNYYQIDNKKSTLKAGFNPEEIEKNLPQDLANEIRKSVQFLKGANSKLILMSAFELVDLSHAWYSWKLCYYNAQKVGLKSAFIDPNLIKSEDKIFSL